MLAGRSTLPHPSGGKIELPLLVPAFSSKGFELKRRGAEPKHDYSETVYELETFGKFSSQSVLVSAYDLHFQHFDDAPDLPAGRATDYLRNTELVFVDSGGYELVPDFDTTEPRTFAYRPKKGFTLAEYKGVLRDLTSLEPSLPLVIANFDFGTRRKPLEVQIRAAQELFYEHHGPLKDFILKPWKKSGTVVEPRELSPTDYGNLRSFDIIGVTEKELGQDLLERLQRVAQLRKGLNDADVSSPIHIWGGLDPIMTPLYFFAGAEIFDGVSWLRYAFNNGVAINREVHSILTGRGVFISRKRNHARASMDNLDFINSLTIALQQWLDFEATNFTMFDPPDVAERLEEAYGAMKTKIDVLREAG